MDENEEEKEPIKTEEELKREALMLEKADFICSSKWCKSSYTIERYKYYDEKITSCPKCRSFDEELSGGVGFDGKQYSGERHDGKAHPVDFKFSDYNKGKWGKFWDK